MPADDLTDPAPATTFAHLDATTVLSRGIAELGIYPAVDPLDSTSRIMDPNVVGQEHYEIARGVQKILQVTSFLSYKYNNNLLMVISWPWKEMSKDVAISWCTILLIMVHFKIMQNNVCQKKKNLNL